MEGTARKLCTDVVFALTLGGWDKVEGVMGTVLHTAVVFTFGPSVWGKDI